ncbi:hypothetical protein ALT1000_150061 [Alteromonas macleodii]
MPRWPTNRGKNVQKRTVDPKVKQMNFLYFCIMLTLLNTYVA